MSEKPKVYYVRPHVFCEVLDERLEPVNIIVAPRVRMQPMRVGDTLRVIISFACEPDGPVLVDDVPEGKDREG